MTEPTLAGAAAVEDLDCFTDALIEMMGAYYRLRPESSHAVGERRVEPPAPQTSPLADSREELYEWEELHAVRDRILANHHARRLSFRREPSAPRAAGGHVRMMRMREAIEEAERTRCAARVDLAVAAGAGRELWEEECIERVELPRHVPSGKYIALTVSGESMEPALHAGDVLLVRLGPAVRPETVVVACRPDHGYVVKRVARVGRHEIELASLHPDYAPVRIPRKPELIVGTVIVCWCGHERAGRVWRGGAREDG